jgi:beta-lactamase regulating signal transducer with metallopeptidase domain
MQLAEAFAWCVLQVSVITLVVACLYLAANRWRWGVGAALLMAGLGVVGLLTLLCISPWPRWSALDLGSTDPGATISERDVIVRDAEVLSNRALNAQSPASTGRMMEQAAPANSIEAIDFNLPAATRLSSPKSEAALPRIEYAVPWLMIAVVVAWIVCGIGLARFLFALASLRRLRRSSIAVDDASLLHEFNELSRRMRIKHAACLRETQSLGVAATCGWWKPVILLPATWRQWTPDERRAVLAHELAHIRENHFPKSLCSQLAVVAHFYHPVVHWLARRLRFEQEVAADELAARVFGDSRRYVSALAALALGAAPPSGTVGSLGVFMSKPFLMRRLAMLRQGTDPKHLSGRVKRLLPISLVIVIAIAVAGVRGEDRPTPDESASRASNSPQETAAAVSISGEKQAVSAVWFVDAPAPECYARRRYSASPASKRACLAAHHRKATPRGKSFVRLKSRC